MQLQESVRQTGSAKFILPKPNGLDLSLGFSMLKTELENSPIKWLNYQEVEIKQPIPKAVRLWKLLQQSLEGRGPQTAGCYSKNSFAGADEGIYQKWLDMMGSNQKTKKETMQYRKDYLARNKPEWKRAKVIKFATATDTLEKLQAIQIVTWLKTKQEDVVDTELTSFDADRALITVKIIDILPDIASRPKMVQLRCESNALNLIKEIAHKNIVIPFTSRQEEFTASALSQLVNKDLNSLLSFDR